MVVSVAFSSPLLCCLCVSFGALHISVALHLSVITALSDGSAGVTQEGVFFFLYFCFAPPSSRVLVFVSIARRVRPTLSLVDRYIDVSVYSRACRFRLLGSIVSKNSQFVYCFLLCRDSNSRPNRQKVSRIPTEPQGRPVRRAFSESR